MGCNILKTGYFILTTPLSGNIFHRQGGTCYGKSHTHLLNGPLSGTTRVSQYHKGKTNLDFTEARDSEWQWLQLGHMQVCTLLQTDTTPALHRSVFTGRMPFLPPNQQRQSTEGNGKSMYQI